MNYYSQMQYPMQYQHLGIPNFQTQDRRPSMPVIGHQVNYQRRQSLPTIPIKMDKPGPGKTKCKFTPQEDRLLERLVQEHGEGYWDDIAEQMPGRNARQCKDRWTRYLSPDLNKSEWTPEEEELLLQLVHELNFRWVHIARRFKGRTDNQIKNKWNVMKKYLEQQNGKYVRPKKKVADGRERPNIPAIPTSQAQAGSPPNMRMPMQMPPQQTMYQQQFPMFPQQNQQMMYQQPQQFMPQPQQMMPPQMQPQQMPPPQFPQPIQQQTQQTTLPPPMQQQQPASDPTSPDPMMQSPNPNDPFDNLFQTQDSGLSLFDSPFEPVANDDFFDMF